MEGIIKLSNKLSEQKGRSQAVIKAVIVRLEIGGKHHTQEALKELRVLLKDLSK